MISVVVGTLNRKSKLHECISSIIQETSIELKIYITDAGSTDGTVDYLNSIASENIEIILHKQKLGQAKAYNEIFEKIYSPFVCWLSDDNVLTNNILDKAVRILEKNHDIGLVGLKVKDVSGPFVDAPYIGGVSEAGILNVNQGVLRTELLHSLGGFSEEFMDYGIDPDLTARVINSGYDVVYTKDIGVLHYRDWGIENQLVAQMDKQERYKNLYRSRYVNYDLIEKKYHVKNVFFSVLRHFIASLANKLNNDNLRRLSRDIYNIGMSRYIKINDPILSMKEEFHLRQYSRFKTRRN